MLIHKQQTPEQGFSDLVGQQISTSKKKSPQIASVELFEVQTS